MVCSKDHRRDSVHRDIRLQSNNALSQNVLQGFAMLFSNLDLSSFVSERE